MTLNNVMHRFYSMWKMEAAALDCELDFVGVPPTF